MFVPPFFILVQYVSGAISAPDLVRSLERDVAGKIPGCDLEDAVAAALEATLDKRKRDLLSKARYALQLRWCLLRWYVLLSHDGKSLTQSRTSLPQLSTAIDC